MLLKNGADDGAKDKEGEISLHRAAEGEYTTPALLLLKKGVTANIRNMNGVTALTRRPRRHWTLMH